MSVAGAVVPSLNSTVIGPPSAARAITWSFVMISPLSRMTTPDPVSPAVPFEAERVTTDGTTVSATDVALHEPASGGGTGAEVGLLVEHPLTTTANARNANTPAAPRRCGRRPRPVRLITMGEPYGPPAP